MSSLRYNFSDEEIRKMVDMYIIDLKPIYEIAKEFNVDSSVIKKRLLQNNVTVSSKSPYNYLHWVERGMMEEEAKIKVKHIRPSNIEYWINMGFSEEESQIKVESQRLTSLRGYIERYGELLGSEKWVEKQKKLKEWGSTGSCNLIYYINKGFSEEEAKIELSKRQSTFSKEKCIEKYGYDDGILRFTERQTKWSKSLSSGGKLKIGYSKTSQELFYKILENYCIEDKDKVFFATHNKEFKISKSDGGVWLYDFTDIKNNKIIEYNGDLFHGNPKKFKGDDHPHPFNRETTAKEIWEKDEIKINKAKENGFDILVIWDSEYRWGNKDKIINKCLKFLKG